jgi:2-polyprenyl-6-hydroxyphenyl methylase/3-demethylubiquinone-9 3-methyltransferase
VAHYASLAATWWDPAGPFWPLHRLNALRVQWICAQLAAASLTDASARRPLQGLRVLDVGCGGGILAEALARLGAEVHAIDVVPANIEVARLHAQAAELDIRYELTTVEALAAGQIQYDLVFDMEVVEHVADLRGFLRAGNALVRPGGGTFIATINRTPLAWLFAIVGAEYVLRWLPRGTHRYSMLRKPAEIAALLEADGLQVKARAGVRVNPVTRVFTLQERLSVNYMLYAEKCSARVT